MQLPISAPVSQLDQLIDRKILEIDKQYSKVCVPCDCIERFRHSQTRLADLRPLVIVIGVQSSSIAAVERHDG